MTGSTAAIAALRRTWAGLWAEFWAGITDLSKYSPGVREEQLRRDIFLD